jgi:hypothetical protein
MAQTKRQSYEILRGQLEAERSSFLPHWRDLGDYILPRRPRFVVSDTNKGERRNLKIIDSTATLACRTLKSGMMGGVTSPARPWFKLTTPDPKTAELGHVKEWLSKVEENMAGVFLRSNLYQALPNVYGDLGTFGTAAMMIEEDFSGNVVRFHVFPIGSYMIATDADGRVNVFFREFRMTVRQVIKKFGKRNSKGDIDWSNISSQTRTAWEDKNREQWVDICHVIQPNEDHEPKRLESKYKKFSSCYYEKNASDDKVLSEMGYDFFPVMVPRWEVTGEDAYGTDCPGMTALGDIKQLQIGEKRIAQAIEKMINPPLKGPSALISRKVSLLPGDFTADDSREGQQGLRAVHEVTLRVAEAEQKQEQIRGRIKRSFFEDLFLMMTGDDRSNITAMEISVRKEEKLLMLGSVLEQLNQDLLDPLIDNTFEIMVRQSRNADGSFMENGLIPPPPEEVAGMRLKVEYVSIMAAAQKALGIAGIERFMGFAIQVAQIDPSAVHKIDTDQTLDVYADRAGVPPGVVRSDEAVAAMREQIAKANQAAQQAEMIAQGAQAAKNLAGADMSGDNALSRLVENANAGNLT